MTEAEIEIRKKIKEKILRQRANYIENNLFVAEYCNGMADAALIVYDADIHEPDAQSQSTIGGNDEETKTFLI